MWLWDFSFSLSVPQVQMCAVGNHHSAYLDGAIITMDVDPHQAHRPFVYTICIYRMERASFVCKECTVNVFSFKGLWYFCYHCSILPLKCESHPGSKVNECTQQCSKKTLLSWSLVAQAYNPTCMRGWGRIIASSRPAWTTEWVQGNLVKPVSVEKFFFF